MTPSSSQLAAAFLRDAATADPATRSADFPDALRPHSSADAYAIQDLQIGKTPVSGWKILATATPDTYSCAAIPETRVIANDGPRPQVEDHIELEVEIAVRIGHDLPTQDAPYSQEQVAKAITTAHAAFELVETRFAFRPDVPKLSALADFQSNYSVTIGSGTLDWRDLDLPMLDISLRVNGDIVETAHKGASADQIIAAVTWLANHAKTRAGGGLQAGQFIITGARIGPSPMPAKGDMVATVDKIGSVRLISA